jgi:hypothetical protein
LKTAGIIFACVGCLVGGLAVGFNLQKGTARQTFIKWSYGNAALEIDLDQDLANDSTLLKKIFSTKFSKAGATDWLKGEEKIFHFLDTDLTNEFASLEYESEMAEKLRNLRVSRTGPWDYQQDTIRMGILGADARPGYCNVCQSKKYRGKTLKLFDLRDNGRSIILEASGRYECLPGLQVPDLQLSPVDAEKLLGFGSFNKYEYALALIVSD